VTFFSVVIKGWFMENKNNGHYNGSLSQNINRHAAHSLTTAGICRWTDTFGHKPHKFGINERRKNKNCPAPPPPAEKFYNN
jgi:hypothetical protein